MIEAPQYAHDRDERLYVSDQWQAFFLTGQTHGKDRKAFVDVYPFSSLNTTKIARLRDHAENLSPDAGLLVLTHRGMLRIHDLITGTISEFPVSKMGERVQHDVSAARAAFIAEAVGRFVDLNNKDRSALIKTLAQKTPQF